ncbi:MAG: 50S ribosomal protein L19e [Nanoarchaeota archaeon]|nr:50S ribosomal protein L19e [Nanoarchaeota archaeon]
MKLNVQKRLAADIIKGSSKRVRLDTSRLEEIKEAITKVDIKALIEDKAITIKPKRGISKGRARKAHAQKKKGLRRGQGSRKGTANARDNKKKIWMNKIRLQRKFIRELKEKEIITCKEYRELYNKTKGGFFRSRRHIKLYLTDQGVFKK